MFCVQIGENFYGSVEMSGTLRQFLNETTGWKMDPKTGVFYPISGRIEPARILPTPQFMDVGMIPRGFCGPFAPAYAVLFDGKYHGPFVSEFLAVDFLKKGGWILSDFFTSKYTLSVGATDFSAHVFYHTGKVQGISNIPVKGAA